LTPISNPPAALKCDERRQRIKNGFSWPACLFGPLWAFVKRAWLLGFLLLIPVILLRIVEEVVYRSGTGTAGALFVLMFYLVYMYNVGRRGNAWLTSALRRKGYTEVTNGPA
jgi:hypothetical protein